MQFTVSEKALLNYLRRFPARSSQARSEAHPATDRSELLPASDTRRNTVRSAVAESVILFMASRIDQGTYGYVTAEHHPEAGSNNEPNAGVLARATAQTSDFLLKRPHSLRQTKASATRSLYTYRIRDIGGKTLCFGRMTKSDHQNPHPTRTFIFIRQNSPENVLRHSVGQFYRFGILERGTKGAKFFLRHEHTRRH